MSPTTYHARFLGNFRCFEGFPPAFAWGIPSVLKGFPQASFPPPRAPRAFPGESQMFFCFKGFPQAFSGDFQVFEGFPPGIDPHARKFQAFEWFLPIAFAIFFAFPLDFVSVAAFVSTSCLCLCPPDCTPDCTAGTIDQAVG